MSVLFVKDLGLGVKLCKNRQRDRGQGNDITLTFCPDNLEYLIIDIEDLDFPNLDYDGDPPDRELDISALNFFL